MKKFLSLLLATLMILSLAACGQKSPPQEVDPKPDPSINEPAKQEPSEPNNTTQEEQESPAEAEVPEEPDPEELEIPENGFTITTDSTSGAHLQKSVPEVEPGIYQFTDPEIDDEFGYNTYNMPVKISESTLSEKYHALGAFESLGEFKEVWTPYAQELMPLVEKDGLMDEVFLYGEEERGDHLFANDKSQRNSYSLLAQTDNYQSVNYLFTMFVATDEERWDLYDYSEIVSFIQYYTGIHMTTGDVRAMQEIISAQLEAGKDTWTVLVNSNEKDNYDMFRITGSVFTENSQSWIFSADRMISKWDDLYNRGAVNPEFMQTGTAQ